MTPPLSFPGQLNVPDVFNSTPAGFSRTADGRLVPSQSSASVMNAPAQKKRFLLVLQYWRGDVERVDKLANLIADLERVPNPDVDILIFGRKDCKPLGIQFGTVENLKRKFAQVHIMDDAGNYADGFPWAANDMWQDLVGRMGSPVWADRYRCFLNLEWDCVPTRPGWLHELGREFDHAVNEGYAMIGAVQREPIVHVNGVAVYATDINARAKGLDGGCPPESAYDIHNAPKLLPLTMGTPLIQLDYRRPTITPDELFASPAALFHGVRDESANAAVRAEHIDRIPRGEQPFTRSTVFCYRRRISTVDTREIDEQISLWMRGWKSVGGNPVVLGSKFAEQHTLYAEVMARVASFPTTGSIEHANAKWERFLALSQYGGGLMVDFDVLPKTGFSPLQIGDDAAFQLLSPDGCMVKATRAGVDAFIQLLLAYEPDAKATDVTVADVLKSAVVSEGAVSPFKVSNAHALLRSESGWREAKCVHFSPKAIAAALPGMTPSRAMLAYLRGE